MPFVTVSPAAWTCELTGEEAAPPPLTLTSVSSDLDLERVRDAVRLGMAGVDRMPRAPRLIERYAVDLLPGTLLGDVLILAKVVGNSMGVLLLAPVVVAGVLFASGFDFLAHGFSILFGVLFSIVLHELGHVLAFRMLAPAGTPVRIWWSGVDAGLVRRPLSRVREVTVTLAGPLSPAATVLLVWPFLPVAELIAFGITAFGHSLSVFLPGGDRDALRNARGPKVRGRTNS
jgi:hypothetical protein